MTLTDDEWMARALQLAARGCYTTHPNPNVGCVLVREGRVVGEGWHQKAGEPHAEVHALRAAGELARGAGTRPAWTAQEAPGVPPVPRVHHMLQTPCLRLAWMKPSRSPSSTAWVLPTS